MKLLIVESPKKAKVIKGFLGDGWTVQASRGHVRDLPKKEMGVAAPDFKPKYIPTEDGKETLARLGELAKKAEAVYLAPDPDREGEAIAWHLKDALKINNPLRVTYTEVTEKAVLAALAAPREINMALVAAQEGRRVLDRFCGYMVSGPLSDAVGAFGLSAGRVQTPALRKLVERELEIRNFIQTTHYGAALTFGTVDNIRSGWKAAWDAKPFIEDGQEYFKDKAFAAKVAELRTVEITGCEEAEKKSSPPAPFTTSTMQQAANKAFKYPIKKVMSLAQSLYEKGFVTYIRTDSPNLSQEAVDAARTYCESRGWPVVLTPRVWKSKEGAQEAHEAIRPTNIDVEEAGETDEEKALYRLIRLRVLAAQLEDAVYAVRTLQLAGDVDGKRVQFEAKGRMVVSQGWKLLQDAPGQDDEEAGEENPVPDLKAGTFLTALAGELLTKLTKPSPRYTEATLVAQLEKMGIGRPATYASIIGILFDRNYVALDKKQNMIPTELGEKIVASLAGAFSFAEYQFTKELEDSLDDIASGKADYKAVVAPIHARLDAEVREFQKSTGKVCDTCGKFMRRRIKAPDKNGKGGFDFWGCPGWPDCKGKPVEPAA